MAIDASAVLAIALEEEDADVFNAAIARSGGGVMTPINYWEVLVRLQLLHGEGSAEVADRYLRSVRIQVAPTDAGLARAAAAAFQRFRGRPGGRLNLGDCFAYALAEREGDGLLYKGDDFPRTDVKSALATWRPPRRHLPSR